MGEAQTDIDKLKAAFRAWNDTKGASIDTWLDLMADQIDWRSLADGAHAVAWTSRGKTRAEVRAYLIALTSAFAMEHYTVEQYVCDADTIVTIGTTAWRNKATGKQLDPTSVEEVGCGAYGKTSLIVQAYLTVELR